jgi:hypothetical protein
MVADEFFVGPDQYLKREGQGFYMVEGALERHVAV